VKGGGVLLESFSCSPSSSSSNAAVQCDVESKTWTDVRAVCYPEGTNTLLIPVQKIDATSLNYRG
jgi:hypothetical protein